MSGVKYTHLEIDGEDSSSVSAALHLHTRTRPVTSTFSAAVCVDDHVFVGFASHPLRLFTLLTYRATVAIANSVAYSPAFPCRSLYS